MKWQVVGLVVLGMVAAVCASVLVGGIQASRSGDQAGIDPNPEIRVLVACKDLSATQIVGSDAVEVRAVRRDTAPAGYMTDPVQVVGRVLTMPLVKGQAFTKTCFAKEGSGLHLAAALPEGMRAVGVELTDESGLAGILYPGSLVDVLVTFCPRPTEEAVTRTLFQSVQVLSIEQQTIVGAEGEGAKPSKNVIGGASKKHVVTLLVNSSQAEQLQAAMRHGTVALALRNPMDRTRIAEGEQKAKPGEGEESCARTWEMTILRAREKEMKRFGAIEVAGR